MLLEEILTITEKTLISLANLFDTQEIKTSKDVKGSI
jgi:hypothetical protein